MLRYVQIAQNETKVLALTGLTRREFETLVSVFQASFETVLHEQTLEGLDRVGRAYTTYRNSPLPTAADKLLFILVYLKQAPTQSLHGQLFGLSQSNANNWIHLLHRVLNHALATQECLPPRTALIGDDVDHVAPADQPPFFHDGTERPIPRPLDPDEQRFHYSGKKKQHPLKNLLVIADNCRICFLSTTYEGAWHDKAMADQESYALPPSSVLYQDLGFQGFSVAGSTIAQPQKKPRGGTLTPEAKAENRRLASIRIRIEQVIGSVKRCRIVKDKLRLWREHSPDRPLVRSTAETPAQVRSLWKNQKSRA